MNATDEHARGRAGAHDFIAHDSVIAATLAIVKSDEPRFRKDRHRGSQSSRATITAFVERVWLVFNAADILKGDWPGLLRSACSVESLDRADLNDPKLNRAYVELAEHYGTLIDPARARKPKDKPRVERPMPYVRDSL